MHAALVIVGFHANDDVPLLHECVSMFCVDVCCGIRPSIATKTIIIRRMHRWFRIVRCTKCWNWWQIVEHNVTAVHQNATAEFMGQGCRTILHRLRINWSTMLWAFHDCTIIIVIDGKSRNKFENPNSLHHMTAKGWLSGWGGGYGSGALVVFRMENYLVNGQCERYRMHAVNRTQKNRDARRIASFYFKI